jgi:hypothetical protein
MKKNDKLEALLQKYLLAKGQTKLLLLAIIKNKYPDAKIPK